MIRCAARRNFRPVAQNRPTELLQLLTRPWTMHILWVLSDTTLDLSEVNLVDIDVVRFLGACQAKGVKLAGCSPYIRDWIALKFEREHLILAIPCRDFSKRCKRSLAVPTI